MELIEILKVVVLGIVEGVTEWLPISSTGHMLLVDEFIHMNVSESFKDMFFVVIQLGAILAVVMLFWDKMWPFQTKDKSKPVIRKDVFSMWFKVVVACIPGAIVTLLFDDYIEAHLHTPTVIALALVVYGVAFIVIENWNKNRTPKVLTLEDISYKTAFIIGLFQVLSIIPGTSRSGSTIIGALTIGVSRVAAAEFTFFLAVPVMIVACFYDLLKSLSDLSGNDLVMIVIGFITAFIVAYISVLWFLKFMNKSTLASFAYYRFVVAVISFVYFFIL